MAGSQIDANCIKERATIISKLIEKQSDSFKVPAIPVVFGSAHILRYQGASVQVTKKAGSFSLSSTSRRSDCTWAALTSPGMPVPGSNSREVLHTWTSKSCKEMCKCPLCVFLVSGRSRYLFDQTKASVHTWTCLALAPMFQSKSCKKFRLSQKSQESS